jgi:hypothetical protein
MRQLGGGPGNNLTYVPGVCRQGATEKDVEEKQCKEGGHARRGQVTAIDRAARRGGSSVH